MPTLAILEPEERRELTRIIAELYDFTDGGLRGRRVLIEQANLKRFISGIDLSGAPRTVAGDLVHRVEIFGVLPEEPTKHALGALLSYVLTLGELKQPESAFIANLIVKYSLVADPVYIDKLRAQYGITTAPTRQPLPEHQAPVASTAIDATLPFEVNIQDPQGLESIINSEDNFLDVYLLFGAIYSARAVCRIELPEKTAIGTGFLIGPDLLLTNHHVLKNEDYVKESVVRFDYRVDGTGVVPAAGRVFQLQPDFYQYSPAEAFDYAVVRLKDQPLKEVTVASSEDLSLMNLVLAGKHRGYLVLGDRLIKQHERVNIIQHPDGNPLKVVLTQNYVVGDMTEKRVQYIADTMGGSSGSPVFNQNWEVVALHHSGEPYPPESVTETLKKVWKGRFRANEGIPVRAILKDFKEQGIDRFLPRD